MPDMQQAGPLPSLTPVDGLAETSPHHLRPQRLARDVTTPPSYLNHKISQLRAWFKMWACPN
eukprot:5092698-Prymnesium_polylepis.1